MPASYAAAARYRDEQLSDSNDDRYSDEFTDTYSTPPPEGEEGEEVVEEYTVTAVAATRGQGFQWTGFYDDNSSHASHMSTPGAHQAAVEEFLRQRRMMDEADGPGPADQQYGDEMHDEGEIHHRHPTHRQPATHADRLHSRRPSVEQPDGGAAAADDDDERVLDEEQGQYDEDYEPTDTEIADYCEWLGVDPAADRPLMWIVREALKAPLPEHWRLCYTEDRELYYFNVHTGESIWDHPLDAFYKALYKQEKAKLLKKRQCMRHFSHSMEIKPLAHFFSELGDEESVNDDVSASQSPVPSGATKAKKLAPWAAIPESLVDAIDFRIYVEPVVLPTSGRTVSRHTIINTRWRDPFSRDYVDNRRLVPNVDKRAEVDAWLGNAIHHFFDHLEPSAAGLKRVLRLLPYILDKEEEMSVRGQRRFYEWLKKHSPPTGKTHKAGHGDDGEPAIPPPPPPPHHGTMNASLRRSKDTSKGAINATAKTKLNSTLAGTKSSDVKAQLTPRGAASVVSMLDVIVNTLNVEELDLLINSLLTMATSCSRECLHFIVSSKPQLSQHAAFRSFPDDVLFVLNVAPADLAAIAHSISQDVSRQRSALEGQQQPTGFEHHLSGSHWAAAAAAAGASGAPIRAPLSASVDIGPLATQPPRVSSAASQGMDPVALSLSYATKNSEFVAALQWVTALASAVQPPVNALKALEFTGMLHLAFCMNDSSEIDATPDGVMGIVRSNGGWPASLAHCPGDVLVKLLSIGLRHDDPAQRVQTWFDVAWHGGERGLEYFRQPEIAPILLSSLLALAPPPEKDGALVLYRSRTNDQSLDLLCALLVNHDCLPLDTLKANPPLALVVAFNLLPRLIRTQWRPRHFDATVTTIIELVQQHPVLAWRTIQTAGALFLLRELSRKKRNAEDLRLKLGSLEAVERRQQQTNAINNWALLTSRILHRSSAGLRATTAEAAAVSKAQQTHQQAQHGPPPPAKGSRFPAVSTAARPSPRGANGGAGSKPGTNTAVSPAPQKDAPLRANGLQRRLDQLCTMYCDRASRCASRRDELHAERAGTILTALQALLALRLKPKQGRAIDAARIASMKLSGSADDVGAAERGVPSAAGAPPAGPPPPSLGRRGSSSARPPSGPRRAPDVASSCPNLPPIAAAAHNALL
jgi:hypothetical protein